MTSHNESALKNWRQWVLPRPVDAVPILLYLGVLVLYTYFAVSGTYDFEEGCPWLGVVAISLVVLLLMCLDRLEYWYHRPDVPRYTSAIFRIIHIVLVVTLLFLVGVGIFVYTTISTSFLLDNPWLGGLAILLAGLLLIGMDRLETWYANLKLDWLTPVVIQILRLVLIWGFSFSDNLDFLDQTFIILLIPFGFFILVGRSYGLTGLVWILYLAARVQVSQDVTAGKAETGDEHSLSFLLVYFLSLVLIFAIAYLVKRERSNRVQAEKLLGELAESHRQLQAYAAQVAELATTEERNRLARDIHDSLGHYLTVINVQLEKAMVFRDRNPAEADEAVRESKRLASEALQEVRRSVSALRSTAEPFSLTESLQELVDNMNATGQFTIALDIQGNETGYSRQTLSTLYRAAQEGLTNIQKHAQASQVTVRVQLDTEEAALFIEDNGQGFDPGMLADNGGHYGLQGVKERLELIRGSLKLESEPGQGTSLLITVPKNPLALVG